MQLLDHPAGTFPPGGAGKPVRKNHAVLSDLEDPAIEQAVAFFQQKGLVPEASGHSPELPSRLHQPHQPQLGYPLALQAPRPGGGAGAGPGGPEACGRRKGSRRPRAR